MDGCVRARALGRLPLVGSVTRVSTRRAAGDHPVLELCPQPKLGISQAFWARRRSPREPCVCGVGAEYSLDRDLCLLVCLPCR